MRFLACIRGLCKTDRGSSLVELVLVIPFLLTLVLGAVDFGHAFYVNLEVVNAAHAGAEYGSLHPSDSTGITAAAKQSGANLPNLTVATPTWGCECSDGSSYSASCTATPSCTAGTTRGGNVVHRVQVNTSAVYTTLVPWPGIPSSFTLRGTATVRGN
jgi:Flp pilus assembly protein TadG